MRAPAGEIAAYTRTINTAYTVASELTRIVAEEQGEQEYEILYRAMSWNEYDKRLGLLEQRTNSDGSLFGEGPYVTKSLQYAQKALNSFSDADSYDLIVAYRLPKGSFDRLKSISLRSQGMNDKQAALLGLPVKKKRK